MTYKVAVDAGHGINTSGKRTPAGEREWSFNDKVVDAFIKELNNYEGVAVKRMDDPTGKKDVALRTRTNSANAWGADIYVSFHHNANTGRWGNWTGTETYYYSGSSKGKKLADLLQKANVKAYGLRDRGLKSANLHITRETNMPSALVEGGFMDSTIDIKKMRNNTVLANAGKLSAQAVADYGNLKRKKTKPSAPKTDELYRVRSSWSNVKSQKGAFANLSSAKDLADKHDYNVYDSKGKLVHSGKPTKKKYVEITTSTLWVYDKADWNAKHSTVKKGEVFTIKRTLTVGGSTMHQLKSGLYITNNSKYVRVYEK